ncbi:MAG: DUF2095 family protein [Desulfurococcaceae archaeon]|nr:DUF2095 family protein [Desulfurococcaceae archaeon]
MSQEYEIEEFKKRFPHLAEEILSGKTKSIRLKVHIIDPWRGYVPTAVDYIRRCKTIEEAFEVLDYLVKRNELSLEEAEKYKELLRNGGIEAFGGRKEDNYYYKEARKFWAKLSRRAQGDVGEEEL